MKHLAAAGLLLLIAASVASAQGTPQQRALFHKGSVKIWTGVVLVAAGAVIVPVTASGQASSARSPRGTTAGVATMFSGGTLIWLGFRDQRRATSPQTTIGVAAGQGIGVQLRRVW